MELKIVTISKETIKPSSPTPKSLQKYQFSLLDQIAPRSFMPLIYFYPPNILPNSEKSNRLKESLSGILSGFYLLAGRLNPENLHVDCSDQGAPFFQAEANIDLSEVITNPSPRNMNKLLPYKLDDDPDHENLCMAVQITSFPCGGIAVGLMVSHSIADAVSLGSFAETWANEARNGNGLFLHHRPKFETATIFPSQDFARFEPDARLVAREEEHVAKIFTFPASKISALQDRFSGGGFRPTRVEALSGFISTTIISTTKMKCDPNKIYSVMFPVNLRSRFEPPLSEHHFGNLSLPAMAFPAMGDGGYEFSKKFREGLRAVNGDYLARLKEGDMSLAAQADRGEMVTLFFSSLCGLPGYEADFGWGKPVWVGLAHFTCKNVVFLTETKTRDRIEAWIHLKREDMEKFEADLELQQILSSS